MKAFNINDKYFPFTDWILEGIKTEETRRTRSMNSLIGKTVGIIRTGKGKATLVGYVDIIGVIEYDTESFRAAYDRHRVLEGSRYDIEPNGKKYGYILANPVRCEPQKVSAKGIVIRNI